VIGRLFRVCRGWVPGGRAEFHEAMDAADAFVREASEDRRLFVLDFLLEVVRNDLKYDQLTKILYRRGVEPWLWPPFPPVCPDGEGSRIEVFPGEPRERLVSLADECVVVVPWDRRRLRSSVETVGAQGFEFDDRNHRAWYFVPLDICWVFNGKHSIAAGVGLRRGHIRAFECDVSVLFDHVRTDGACWYSRHSGERLGALCDFRIGVLFELARKRRELAPRSSPS